MSAIDLEIDKSQVELLSKNIQSLLNNNGLTINQLAARLKMPSMTLRRILLGETTDPRISTLKLIADYFDVSIDQLIEPAAMRRQSNTSIKPVTVPLIDWVDISSFASNREHFDLSGWQEWQTIPTGKEKELSDYSFALSSKPCLHPRFPLGTTFVIDPQVVPKNNDFVLVSFKGVDDITIKLLKIDPPESFLCSVCLDTKPMLYDEKTYGILGVVMLTIHSRL